MEEVVFKNGVEYLLHIIDCSKNNGENIFIDEKKYKGVTLTVNGYILPENPKEWKQDKNNPNIYRAKVGDAEITATYKNKELLTLEMKKGKEVKVVEPVGIKLSKYVYYHGEQEILSDEWKVCEIPQIGGTKQIDKVITNYINSLNKNNISKASKNYYNMAIKKKCLPKKYAEDTKEESCKKIEADLLWNQSKINKVWVEAKEMSQKFGTIIDPRLLIAIILQEGTGSFDTNFNPSDAFNAGYIQPDFDIDLKDAFNSHIMGKIWVYSNCGNEFKNSCKKFLEKTSKNGTKYSGKGTLFEYVNSNVYRLRMRNGQLGLKLGAYATDFQWHLNLSNFFNTMCFEYKDNNSKWNATDRYSDYIIKHPIKWPQEIKKPNFKFKLTSDGTNSATVDGFPMIAAD